ncbi:tandem-95 repeat protein [Planctomycetes bacterium K23_9]|uniref:Probable pectate lyase C n=1 Tax=Stieleria marina TaxID=1930275 RepID=A0A517NRE0_9BACT|nr:hypothetical protein K239x_16420 [Planctomycetes bacterium K23_9]
MTLKRQPRRKPSRTRSPHKSDRRLSHETLERRELLAAGLGIDEGPRLIAVSANSGEQFGLESNNQLSVAPTELTLRFGGDLIDESTLAGIQFRRAGGDGSSDPIVVSPGFIGFEQDNGSNIIVARFAETLPDGQYTIDIAGFDDTNAGIVGLRDIDGDLLCPPNALDEVRPSQLVRFNVEVGPRVVGVVPQPVETIGGTRVQRRDQVWVFFNDDPLSNPNAPPVSFLGGSTLPVVNPQLYKLILTNGTIENTDDGAPFIPQDVLYDPTLNRAVLTFDQDLSELVPVAANGNTGTFRLRIGSGDALPTAPLSLSAAGGSGDLFSQAMPLGVTFSAGTQSVVVSDGLIQASEPFVSQWPGSTDAVGSRDQRRDTALVGRVDTHTGINVFPYNFATLYGTDPQLNNATNAITDAQKDRAREVLDLYSERLGVTFIETENEGLQIVTGDLRTIVITADTGAGADTPLSIYRVNESDPSQGVLVMDAGENWYDAAYGLSPDSRPSWFVEAVRGIGSLLGIGNLFELPEGVGAGGSSPDEPNAVVFSNQFYPDLPVEPSFISHSDITLGQALHRPESNDVDFYSFNATSDGHLDAETIAERLDGSSLLDTHINVYQEINGSFELIARNDDFYSDDSFVGIDLTAGQYIIGVSASGNENYNGEVSGSGLGGVSEGRYELRVTFTAANGSTILDSTGTKLDGDADGNEGGDFNFWFRTARDISTASANQARTIFVDKLGDNANDGSLGAPLRTISAAIAKSTEGDIIRLLPNGGADGLISTTNDNLAYEIGRNGSTVLRDGAEFEVPKGVTVMIDAGSILKLQRAKISVGSESVDEDRSQAALQVLGQPNRFDDNGNLTYQGEVIFTSYNNEAIGFDTNPAPTTPQKGNWAGIEFRNDFDFAEGQPVWETEGIFLDYVSHANMSYGGGSVDLNDPLIVNPLHMASSRPTLIYNTITDSADAAISADPNSFRETNFHAPIYQRSSLHTSDYGRVGPEISGNTLLNNSFNSLFVRVETPAAGQREQLTVSGRFDDTDIVHTLSEVLEVRGQAGGPVLLEVRPNVLSAILTTGAADPTLTGTLAPGQYDYRVTFVDELGNESLASLPTERESASGDGLITIDNLPTAPSEYAGRRLYRLDPGTTDYIFVTQLDRDTTTYVDDGETRGGLLRSEQRPDGSGVLLSTGLTSGTLFPGDAYSYRFTFVDSIGGETQASAATSTLVAPNSGSINLANLPTIPDGFVGLNVYRIDPATTDYFLAATLDSTTSTFSDTGAQTASLLVNDGGNGTLLSPRLNARLSIDPGTIIKMQNARIEVGAGANFYAEGRDGQEIIFTSRLDDSVGAGGTFDTNNDAIGDNAAAGDWAGLVFRQDANVSLDYVDISNGGGFTANNGVFTSFNAIEILQADVRITNSNIHDNASGFGVASTRDGIGFNDDAAIFVRGSQPVILNNTIQANLGAAISINPNALDYNDVLDGGRSTGLIDLIDTDQDNQGPLIHGNRLDDNTINGLRVRSEILTTESVWDDTDIVHVVDGQIVSLTHHFRSGLRLQSDPEQGLVVKFGPAGQLIADGIPLDIEDRIGGTLQVIGTPGNPVILTSINDDTVGAGFTPDGRPMIDTLSTDGAGTAAVAGDWLGLTIDTFANDRNVAHVLETEAAVAAANAENATANNAQRIGDLADHQYAGDENERLGFNVRGTLADPADVDVYSFTASGGTTVYLDIDDTTIGFDSVLELVDVNDVVLARSDDSFAEGTDRSTLQNLSVSQGTVIQPLFLTGVGNQEGPNPMDAGMRVILPGSSSSENVYYVRVRSASGLTSGQYTLSARLLEADEVSGSTVQFADIRYATNAITVTGAPLHSPLTVDAQESLDYSTIIDPTPGNGQSGDEFTQETANNRLVFADAQADRLGNLATSDRGSLSVSGNIGNLSSFNTNIRLEDVDVYQVDVFSQQIEPDVFDSENRFVTVSFDVDYADGLGRPNTSLAVYNSFGQLVLHGRDSNIADDVGRPLQGVDSTNLSAGSAGVLDAHIGPVEVPEGSYFVVVSNAAAIPATLDQFFNEAPVESTVRLQPINSVRRLIDDSLDGLGYTAEAAQTDFLDTSVFGPVVNFTNESIVPYKLDDIRLFVSLDTGISGNNQSTLASFNPFTGTMERLIGQSLEQTGDLAIRDDGQLYSYGYGPPTGQFNDGDVGDELLMSPVDGSASVSGTDAITFSSNNAAGTAVAADNQAFLLTTAIAFPTTPGSTVRNANFSDNAPGYIIGVRGNGNRFVNPTTGRLTSDQGIAFEIPESLTRNLFYTTRVGDGNVSSRGSFNGNAHRMFPGNTPYNTSFGPASGDREFGIVDTGFIFNTGGDGGDITGMTFDPNGGSSDFIGVTNGGGVHSFDYRTTVAAPASSDAFGYDGVIPTTFHGTATRDPAHAGSGAPVFTGMTLGPPTIEDGVYENVIFATTIDGWLYALEIDQTGQVQASNVFYNGKSAIPLTFIDGFEIGVPTTGAAFTHLETNPWHLTGDRFDNDGHGIDAPFDQSRGLVNGGTSLYYGFEVDGNTANNTISRGDGDGFGELAPGGSQGSVISQPINLEGYSSADKPTLYFSYLLDVEADDDYLRAVRLQNDSFRVFGAGDDGEWQLLATNDDYRELPFDDEYDHFNDTNIPVQELFDSGDAGETTQWRQARVDLGPLAGSENVRIRFDFSTAGSMRVHHGAIDFVAVPGDEVVDNEELRFQTDFVDVSFETIVGRDIVLPAGSELNDGDQFSVTGPEGPFVVTFNTVGNTTGVVGEVVFAATDTAADISAAVFAVLPTSLNPLDNNDGTIDVLAATDFEALGDAVIGQSNPIQFNPSGAFGAPTTQLAIPAIEDLVDGEIIRLFPANVLFDFDFDNDGIDFGIDADFQFGTDVDGNGVEDSFDLLSTEMQFVRVPTGAPGEIAFSATDTVDDIAARILAEIPSSYSAVYAGNGLISFINTVDIDVQFGPTLIQTANSVSVMEHRATILTEDGDDLTNGSTLEIDSNDGTSFTLTFIDNPNLIAPGRVFFAAGETADTIAPRIVTALPARYGAVVEADGTTVSLLAENLRSGGGALDTGVTPSIRVTAPDGDNLIDGEILRISTDSGPLDITFVASPAVAPIDTVHFQPGDTASVIQGRLVAAINAGSRQVDAAISGTSVLLFGVVDASSDQATSQITRVSEGAFHLTVPDGIGMTNNDTLEVTVSGTTTIITFVESAGPAGPNEVIYQLTDTAADIALRAQAVLATITPDAVVASGAGDTVFFDANATFYAPGGTGLTVAFDYSAFDVTNLDIPDAFELRNGEQVTIDLPGFQTEIITFIRSGTNVSDIGTVPVFYNETDTAADLYQQIIDALALTTTAYVSPDGNGIYSREATDANVTLNPDQTLTQTTTINESAVPLTIPAGANITDGETITFTLKDLSTVTIELVAPVSVTGAANEVVFEPTDSAADVAASVVSQLPVSLRAFLTNTREILLLNVASVSSNAGSSFISFESITDATSIIVNSKMTTQEVAAAIQLGFADGFGRASATDNVSTASADNYKIYGGDRIRLYNTTPIAAGSFGSSSYDQDDFRFDQSTFNIVPVSSPVPGDLFGEDAPIAIATNQIKQNGAQNNQVEGVYLDDIIVGFAERGEMVLNAPTGNRDFVFNPETLPDSHPAAIQPERQNETLLGGYNLEIRTSDEYGVPQDYDPVNLFLYDTISAGRSFDTNDRLVDGAVTIIAQPAYTLVDGDFFTLSDGDRQMKFEFDLFSDGTVDSGSVRVPFNPANTDPAFVARSIRDAINSQQVQGVLNITAATSDGLELAVPTGNRVELFGDNISVNHTGGRYIKLDLVAEETFQGRETSKQIPQVDHTVESVVDTNFGSQLARSSVTSFVDGSVDTLVAVGKIGDEVNTGVVPSNLQDGAIIQSSVPEFDFDSVRIFVQANQTIDIDVDTVGFTKAGTAGGAYTSSSLLTLPVISVLASQDFGATAQQTTLQQTSIITPTGAPGESDLAAFMKFTAPETGYYDVVVSSATLFGGSGGSGEYQLTIRPDALSSAAVPDRDVIMTDFQFGIGDANRVSPQGQIIVSGNFISDSQNAGILATNSARGATRVNNNGAIQGDLLPRPGSAALLRNENSDELIPGVVISNNVVATSGTVGISFGGDISTNGTVAAPTLFGRIINNTVVGTGAGDGIRISGSASPTVLNNVISYVDQGLVATANQTGEIVAGGNAFQNNATDSTEGVANSSFVIPDDVDLFQDLARQIYIPAAGSDIIDSSFASLTDRSNFLQTVKQPIGISPSPIIAPGQDAYGQVRVDDPLVTTPGGVGLNVFIDRGAIDRADDERPVAVLVGPQDATGFVVPGGDQDVDSSFVRLADGIVEFFEVQLIDESGTGPDTDTITSENVILTENGQLLTPDVDYIFGYSANNRTLRLTPISGLWRPDAVYEITLNNQPSVKVPFPGGDGILDGDQVIIQDTNGGVVTFEFDSGFSLTVPQSTLLTVSGTNADVVDGETLTIALTGGETRTLEINRSGGVTAGNIAVEVGSAGTVLELRDAILAALNSVDSALSPLTVAEALDLAPVAIGSSQIQLGTLADHVITGGFSQVARSGQVATSGDGDLFTYSTASATTTFELTTDALVSDPAFTPIAITRLDTPDQIAQRIRDAISADPNLGLNEVRAIGEGKVAIGGDSGDSLTVTAVTTNSLLTSGEPGNTSGTTPITFIPSAQFTPAATAAAIQTALNDSSSAAQTISPGNGQLLISNAQSVLATFGGTPVTAIGSQLGAVSDLAGNPVRETRVNQETRFTIIMPDVVFDFGDAPDSYGTLDASNGARHTVAADRTPRLGRYLDTETDGAPDVDNDPTTGGDDAPPTVTVSENSAIFTLSTPSATETVIAIENVVAAGGEILQVNVNGSVTTFQLTLANTTPLIGSIPIPYSPSDTPAQVAENIALELRGQITEIDESVIMTFDATNATISLEAVDDEDGVSIGIYVPNFATGIGPLYVFTDPNDATPRTVDAEDVLGFINPLDPAGTTMAVNVVGSGLLDAWVDYDRNGIFEDDEQVLTNEPVAEGVDGDNRVTFRSPIDATAGDTWMRVRISESGNLTPTGVGVGGEVEDYQISVQPLALPVPMDDAYTVLEDNSLTVAGTSDTSTTSSGIIVNDPTGTQVLPVRFFVVDQPQNGTVVVTNNEDPGEFIYTPNPDFYGTDTFTYRLSTQQNGDASPPDNPVTATVTITVEPDNDAPAAQNQLVSAIEDTEQEYLASDLLAGAVGHASPGAGVTAPLDESNQTVNIVSISADGFNQIVSDGQEQITPQGGRLRAAFSGGFVTSVFYTPGFRSNPDATDFNSDIADILDTFQFTVQDDGAVEFENGTLGAALPVENSQNPQATVSIRVEPVNDTPALTSETIASDDANYLAYYSGLGQTAPIPTEDNSLVIPEAFLLSNDASGPATAIDEVNFLKGNDAPLQIVGVSLANPSLGQISLLPSGDVSFVPAANVFGRVDFVYEVEDLGIDRALDGTATLRPVRQSITSSIVLEPTNDAPVAYDRALTIAETVEPAAAAQLPFTAGTLISGLGTSVTSPITINGTDIVVVDGASMIDGNTLRLTRADGLTTVVEFSTTATPSTGTDVLIQYTTTDTAAQIATSLATSLTAVGVGGTPTNDTVSFASVNSIATGVFTTSVVADATSVTVVDGASLTGGETITVTDAAGRTTVFEFSETGFSVDNADVLVAYTDADDATTVANSLRAAFANNGIGSIVQAGVGNQSIVQFVSLVVSVDDAATQITRSGDVLTLPDGANFINGETITVDDGSGGVSVIEFNTTGTPSAGTDFVVIVTDTDPGNVVASNLVAVLQNQFFGATANGADVTFHTVTNAVAAPPATAIVTTSSSLTLPAGRRLVDGETVTLTLSDSTPVVVEFNTTGVASTGTDFVVQYAPADIADSIATRVEVALRAAGFGVTASGAELTFTNVNTAALTELASAPGEFNATLSTPFNEDDQNLRVVAFSTALGTIDALVDGDGTHTLPTIEGGQITVTFNGGAFTTGFYAPATDYNELAPFQPNDFFTYIVEDEDQGQTVVTGTGRTVDLPSDRSLFPGTVTITVTATNDTPTFTSPSVIEIAEDSAGGTVDNVIQNVLPSMATALDEVANQTVTFSIDPLLSNVPVGLMTQLPTIDSAGGLTFFPAPDAVGTATYVVRGTDDGVTPQSTDATITVHVRPINDAPRFNTDVVGQPGDPLVSDINNEDDAYAIGREVDPITGRVSLAPITYTLREDNSQPVGAAPQPYYIPFRQDPNIVGYNRPGLLDVFMSGPDNELDGTLGGDQTLRFFTGLPATTAFGGQLTPVIVNSEVVGVNYTPPLNYNNEIGGGGTDSFVYTVRDNSTVGGETYNLDSGNLEDDQLTAFNTVLFDLNPVNDRPEFTIANPSPEAPEDAGRVEFPNFAFNISAGPVATAFDEVDVTTGQPVVFSLTSLTVPATQSQQFFDEFPTISPDGTLAFEAAENVFGKFEFRVFLNDEGPGNDTRGDLISSIPSTITITIQPENDAPVVDPNADPLTFTLREDGTIDIPVNGDSQSNGLLKPFLPGPANESEDITPGGNQTVSLATPITASTSELGTLTQVLDPNTNELIALRYTPRENFVGTDSFIYTVTDDGITVDIGTNSTETSDPKFAGNTVTLNVTPINDEPLFSGAGNVVSQEDEGLISIPQWATNVQAGPPTASDEAQSQSLSFTITQVNGDPNLFTTPPTAAVVGSNATLTYQAAPDANGVATFEVFVVDTGPNNLSINDDNTSETKTFTIRVNAINDPPSFVPGGVININEDLGQYNDVQPWATDVSAGPNDEALQTVRFEVITPASVSDLFQTAPTIDDNGFLRFTTATNAVGTANLQVTAIDSDGERSETATLQIVIGEVNDVPLARTDVIDTNEDAVLIIPSSQLLANDIDPDLATNPNEVLRVLLSASQFSFNGASLSYNETTGDITYDPRNSDLLQGLREGQLLVDSFSYAAQDASGFSSNSVTVSLNITGINDAPKLVADTPTLNPAGVTIIRPLENDSDIDGQIDPTSIVITLQPAFGSLDISDGGIISYTPFGNFSTEDTFRYTVADDLGLRSEPATITISANAAPIARDDVGGSFINEAFVIDVAANDFDPDSPNTAPNRGLNLNSIIIAGQPIRGNVEVLSGGSIRYTPDADFVGADQFQYSIADINGRYSEPATVDVRFSNSRLQNAVRFHDVNADGDISPLDALLVINLLAEEGGEIPNISPDVRSDLYQSNGVPVHYYDANGDQKISPADILFVINQLAEQAANDRGQSELISSEILTSTEPTNERIVQVDSLLTQDSATKVVDASVVGSDSETQDNLDFIDLIVDSDDETDQDDRLSALDAAFGDLI